MADAGRWRRDTGDSVTRRPDEKGVRPPGDAASRLGDYDRISHGIADVLVHRLFGVGLELHAALTYIEEHIAEDIAVRKIHKAISGLDEAIKDFRGVVFDVGRGEAPAYAPGSLRALIVEAVERASALSGGNCPAISLGGGLDAVTDDVTAHRVARLVHQVLMFVPGDHLAHASVEVAADPRPPAHLVVHIDAPRCDLAGVARLASPDGHHVEISCQRLGRSPVRSRIRLTCRVPRPDGVPPPDRR